tara:strand:+ start:307 stop:483 length:177 start_codon:yes stop_codon:yes gene_type:complete
VPYKEEIMNFLSSPNVSLACAAVNVFFAVTSFSIGNIGWGLVGVALAGLCFSNYLKAR